MKWKAALGAALALALTSAAPAAADTVTIGSIAPAGLTNDCSGCSFLQPATDPASPGYAVPTAPAGTSWRVISWSSRGNDNTAGSRLQIWRPTATAGEF